VVPAVVVMVMMVVVMVFVVVAAFVCQGRSSKQHHCYEASHQHGHYPASQLFASCSYIANVTDVSTHGWAERLA
jgi:heme/copper-type cytochrome/quinol oxidase subunit 2